MLLKSVTGACAWLCLVLVTALPITAPLVCAQEFKLAMSSPPVSMDPHFYTHFHNHFPTSTVLDHLFETLVTMKPDSHVKPALAQ